MTSKMGTTLKMMTIVKIKTSLKIKTTSKMKMTSKMKRHFSLPPHVLDGVKAMSACLCMPELGSALPRLFVNMKQMIKVMVSRLACNNDCYNEVCCNICYDKAGHNSCYKEAGLNSCYDKGGCNRYYDEAGRIGIHSSILWVESLNFEAKRVFVSKHFFYRVFR